MHSSNYGLAAFGLKMSASKFVYSVGNHPCLKTEFITLCPLIIKKIEKTNLLSDFFIKLVASTSIVACGVQVFTL